MLPIVSLRSCLGLLKVILSVCVLHIVCTFGFAAAAAASAGGGGTNGC